MADIPPRVAKDNTTVKYFHDYLYALRLCFWLKTVPYKYVFLSFLVFKVAHNV